jgi:predicted O-methyltransferase YrrM
VIPDLRTLKELETALVAGQIQDDRPEWLKNMASASDPTALYYRFFHELVKRFHPLRVLEIGTYVGTSAAHFGFANTDGGSVLTIDVNPDAKLQLERTIEGKGLYAVKAMTYDSMQWIKTHQALDRGVAIYDVLFIDGLHNFNQTYGEYAAYRQLVKDGGLIFFDDLELDMATRDMQALWEFIPDPKIKLDGLHYTGFGVCEKNPNVLVQPWSDVIGRAEIRMQELASRK